MKRGTANTLALAFAVAGCLVLGRGAIQLASDRVRMAAADATATPAERLVPTLPSLPSTPLPRTLRPAVTSTPMSGVPAMPGTSRAPAMPVNPSPAPTAVSAAPGDAVVADPTTGPADPAVAPVVPAVAPSNLVASPELDPGDIRWRFGAVDRLGGLNSYDVEALNAGWFLAGMENGEVPPGTELAQIVDVYGGNVSPDDEVLRALVVARPGALWEIGNEPDVIWQSNSTPEQYARAYHHAYTLIKGADPTARVAVGAVSQPTPLRLTYLDLVLEAYQGLYGEAMPVDIWAVHNSILREERNSWGVDIPPGLGNDTGRLHEVEDNDRLDIFQQQLIDFRVWMRDRGYRDRPLYLTEFSVLMPAEYGFPPERVIAFMTGAFNFLLGAVDDELGYPADGNRLVQRWVWYSVADTDEPDHYPTGNLFDPETKEMTAVGRAFADYVATH